MPAYEFSPFAIPAAVAAAVVAILAVAVLATRFSRASGALFCAGIAAAIWQVSSAVLKLSVDEHVASIWGRVGFGAALIFAAALYQFIVTILPPATHRRMIAGIVWLTAAQLFVLTLTTHLFVAGVRRFWWGLYPVLPAAGRVLYPLFFGGMFVISLMEIVRVDPALTGTERSRLRIFAIALAIVGLAVIDLMPAYGIAIIPLGWMSLLAGAAVTVYAVRKHGVVPFTTSIAATEIISTMRDLLLVSDRDGRIRFANNAACAFLGYTREEIVGRPLDEVLAPASGADTAPLQGFVRDREYIFRTRMGQPIELTLSHSPIMLQGEVTGAVIIGRDLRERKRYEWEARRAVTLLESTLDSTADGILVIGQDGRVLTWNQRFADLWGIPAELMASDEDQELIGQLVERLNDPAGFLGSLAALHEHPEVESVDVLELKDGRRIEQYSIGRYLDEAPLRVWSFRDVTARLAAEEALRDSETRYRLLFEQNAAGVCLTTVSGTIIDCNATFADMAGFEPEELKNRDLREVCKRQSIMEEIMRRLEATPTVRGLEIEMRRRGGARVSTLANVSLLGTGERALVHMTAVDISDRKRAEEQVEHQAYHDALTQLPNRRLFVERLELSLLAAKRTRGNVGVLFIDLDRFKTINDTLGHSVADELLIEIAKRLRQCVRQTDTVARHGGDEFTVILPDLHQPEDAAQVAEKILERVVEPVVSGANTIDVTASIGIAVYPFDGSDIDSLLRNADDAMYRAKQGGRNQYQLCTEQIRTRAMERLSMHSRLHKAMASGELALAYQPVVSLASGDVTGAEAMVRWHDPERGVIEAAEFIAVAEETRLIVPLGEWMLFTACRQIREWSEAGLQPMRVAINISGRQFQQRDLAVLVRRAVDEARINPSFVELEIRESTAMRDAGLTVELLKQLRDTGISIAINDFGSAQSSLGSLRSFPVQAVKLDRRLLENIPAAATDAAIVDAVIAVSRTLGVRVAAEGIQQREQFEFLKSRECDEAQGPYFSGALDPEDFRLLVANSHTMPHRRSMTQDASALSHDGPL